MVSLYFRTTLNEGIKAFAAAGGDANHIVECHERQSGDEPPHPGIVSSIHLVLNRIG